MNPFLIIILAILAGTYLLDVIVNWLNVRHLSSSLPREFDLPSPAEAGFAKAGGWYDADKYRTAQQYLKDNTRFEIIRQSLLTPLTILFILFGGFNWVDRVARSVQSGTIVTGLMFAGLLMLIALLAHLPFSIYKTFVVEEKYGFNRTTERTFILDLAKSIALTALIGGMVFAGVLILFEKTGHWAWLYCWLSVSLFQLFLVFIAPVAILPLFNKFVPLGEGELKTEIETYAASQGFKMKGIFTMDGSRRSTKTNALFTGFGKYRRIALFDTLIQRHAVEEVVAVLAHEMGHYQLKHVIKMTAGSLIASGVMFYLMSLWINHPRLFQAFRMSEVSLYAGLFFFAFLYIPIEMLVSIFSHWMSRRYEYEADAYAVSTYGHPDAMISALKRLSVHNLSNLTPHPLKVWVDYSHPPVLRRIEAIQSHPRAVRTRSGFSRDDGTKNNPDLIVKPSSDVSCRKDDDPKKRCSAR